MSKDKKIKKKPNKRTKKVFVRVIAGLLCVIIACITTNKIFDAISESVTDIGTTNAAQQNNTEGGGNNVANPQQNNVQNANGNSNAAADNNSQGAVADPNGNTVTPNGGNTVTPNGGTTGGSTGGTQLSTDPLQFNKAQIVDYYNRCLKSTYSQSKFTVTKTEKIDVKLGEMKLNGKSTNTLQSMANDVVKANTKNETKTKSFSGGNVSVDAKERFILPTNLKSAGVASCNITKSGSGYQINMTLVEERCDFKTYPPYNRACTFPLDFTEIDLGGLGQITSAEFYYPGTTLTATIDGNGRVVKTYVVMPLEVDDAQGKGMGQTLSVDISGHWYCTNAFSF